MNRSIVIVELFKAKFLTADDEEKASRQFLIETEPLNDEAFVLYVAYVMMEVYSKER